MHAVIPLYPGYTALDVVGPYSVLAFSPGWTVTLAAARSGPVHDDRGSLVITAPAAFQDVTAADVVIVPGGPGTSEAVSDPSLLTWLRTVDQQTRWTGSVCSGSLVLGAAGLLRGRRATSHWGWIEYLAASGALPTNERVVVDGKFITAAGVSAGIDMALVLLAATSGKSVAETVQLALEYFPQPPFGADSASNAPRALRRPALDLIGSGVDTDRRDSQEQS